MMLNLREDDFDTHTVAAGEAHTSLYWPAAAPLLSLPG